jgi:hypothetical protein
MSAPTNGDGAGGPLQLPSLSSLNVRPSPSLPPPAFPPLNFDPNLNPGYGQPSYPYQQQQPGSSLYQNAYAASQPRVSTSFYNSTNYPPFQPSPAIASTSSHAADSQSPPIPPSPTLGQDLSASVLKKAPAKKRKSTAGAGKAAQGSGEDEEDEEGKKKRVKTPRACDQCRRKKIRSVEGERSGECCCSTVCGGALTG